MNRLFSGRSDMPFALLLLAPSLLLLGGLVAWPMVSNIEISFLRLPLNPNIESTFVGVSNYVRILSDPGFWHSLWMTVWYTALVVAGSTVLGLAVAILQTIDKSLYEAAEMDGANAWQRFRIVTLPAIMPVLATVVTLRTIWMFYMFADVYLLTTKVDILGVYLYKTVFAFNDLGKAAAISVVLFIIIFAVILLTRKRVNLNGNK
ncbi:sugar ABC transporter permease [Escherichia coli]|uniref:carbohydrate ABC transporter permease n=1 Tax=Shigella boydii TaxID=621 RepID=UPI0001F6705C|nr:sugar ABC transporter permease [Shigella boydii]EFI7837769.1 sugar ABC transporter permease [Escherichia coli]EFW55186.1 Inner membrane ABC transporter permease protein YcjO [Shigella boydii ATCC 9905]RIF72586.1 sugar ABC transporter permease [Shigella boydii]